MERTVSPEDLARLKADREEADRRYNAALTALDAALPRVPEAPHPPPPPDEHQVTPLNREWDLFGGPAGAVSRVRRRLGGFLFWLLAPWLERQRTFNSLLVDHINRNVPVGRQTSEAIASTLAFVREQLEALTAFHSHLIVWAQQITPYVDTKDYEFAGLGRRLHEDNRELVEALDQRIRGVTGALDGLSDELARRAESMQAREKRFEARVAGLGAAHDDLRGSLAIVQQATMALKRELERLRELAEPPARGVALEGPAAGAGGAGAAGPGATASGAGVRGPAAAAVPGLDQARATEIDSYKYVGFEDRFRGSQGEIRARLEEYVPLFAGARDVLDVGCGRGEFLELLAAHGIPARGVDLNHEMVEVCRARGLQVDEGDALGYLRGLPDGALGGLFAAQVVEHLQPDYLLGLLDAAYHKLRPGSRLVLETINPACWFAFFTSYIRDITHVRPLHPDTLSYFVSASGFQKVTVQFRVPYPEHEKLQPVPGGDEASRTINANVERLNALLFTYMDYAVVGERL
jgi:SAM-dependent methyltransferase